MRGWVVRIGACVLGVIWSGTAFGGERVPLLARMTGTAAEAEAGVLAGADDETTAPAARPERVVLFRGVRVFDGVSDGLSGRSDVLVREGVIEHVFYPVSSPEDHASQVLGWLRSRQ